MHSRQYVHTRGGSEYGQDRMWTKRLGWFRRTEDQDWSPLYTERRLTIGVIIGGLRLSASWTRQIWHEATPAHPR